MPALTTSTSAPAVTTELLNFVRSTCGRAVIMISIVSLVLVILLAIFGSSHAIMVPGADYLHGSKVAVAHFPLTDVVNKDPYQPGQDRRTMVSLFMPVAKNSCSNECQNSYMPPETAGIANEQFIIGGKPDAGVFETMSYTVCCGSSTPIDASKIPVVVLEPHVDTSRLLYANIARYISANGVAVILIDHPGDASIVQFSASRTLALATVYNNGTVPLSNFSPLTAWNATVQTAVNTRIADIRFALSQLNTVALLRRQFTTFRFSSGLNTESYGIVGHGLGGSVATSLGLTDANARFSINLSGTPPLINASVANPPLFFFGRQDFRRENDMHWPTTWSYLTGRATEFDLNDSAIFDVTDLPIIVELAKTEGGNKDIQGRALSGYAPETGSRAVTCFIENIIKEQFKLDSQFRVLGDCVRMFEGVVPYPGR
jgi:hypothetical protein